MQADDQKPRMMGRDADEYLHFECLSSSPYKPYTIATNYRGPRAQEVGKFDFPVKVEVTVQTSH